MAELDGERHLSPGDPDGLSEARMSGETLGDLIARQIETAAEMAERNDPCSALRAQLSRLFKAEEDGDELVAVGAGAEW